MARADMPVSKPAGRLARRTRLRNPALLLRDESANAIVEFAMVAPAFIALLLATLNTALIFLTQSSTESAAEQVSRLIMTGQAQSWAYKPASTSYATYNNNKGMTLTDLKNAVCGQLNAMPAGTDPNNFTAYTSSMLLPYMTCANLAINVQHVSSFSSTNAGDISGILNADGTFNTAQLQTNYNLGGGGGIELVQVIYLWPTQTGPLGLNYSNQPNTANRYIIATSVLTTENYAQPTT